LATDSLHKGHPSPRRKEANVKYGGNRHRNPEEGIESNEGTCFFGPPGSYV